MRSILSILILLSVVFAQENKIGSDSSLTILAVGDIMIGHGAVEFIEKSGVDYPFEKTKNIIHSADIAFGNLEGPFGTGGTPFEKIYTFRVPPRYAQGLKNAGFTILSLANNHILDYGEDVLRSTIETLDQLGIAHAGAGRNSGEARAPAIVHVQGKKIAVLCYSLTFPEEFWAQKDKAGTNFPVRENFIEDVKKAKQENDLVMVSFHWGAELMESPKDYQKEMGHLAIDSGADLVVGHHPHVLQGMEKYKGKLIAYSLGNFAFGTYSPKASDSIILKVRFQGTDLKEMEIIPIAVNNVEVLFQPTPYPGSERERVIQKVNELSRELNRESFVIISDGTLKIGS